MPVWNVNYRETANEAELAKLVDGLMPRTESALSARSTFH